MESAAHPPRLTRLAYLLPFVLFLPAARAMLVGGIATWFLPVWTFLLIPLAEQGFSGSTANPTPEQEQARLADPLFDWMLWLVVPAQYCLLGLFLWRMAQGVPTAWELVGTVATMGIACGVYGINVAHELGHRRTRHEQWMAQALLLTSLYMHFFVEHNRGHHRRVATPDDPASARRGETVYGFWVRSIVGSAQGAWALERDRLARTGHGPWRLDNAIVRHLLIQGALLVAIGTVFGGTALLGFLAAAGIGILMLETVNYLEHYGLQRGRTERGVWERVRPVHSWNTDRPLGRLFLFELTRHSDHHAHATRKYQVLRHFDESPQLPSGYPGMMVLSLVPPLFFRVMDPRVDQHQASPEAAAAA